MRSTAEILDFIDLQLSYYAARPECYASSPRALEDLILLLETFRGFILEDSDKGEAFNRFAASLGYGTASICHEPGEPDVLSQTDRALFQRVAQVLVEFLRANGRLRGSPAPTAGNQ